jgi:hypothetical protein
VNTKERTKASMYGNSSRNVNSELTREEVDALIFEKKTSEYGFPHFQDPDTQTFFGGVEEEYRLKNKVREAYDGQELLRRMRTDIKREYLTRKKQVSTLQQRAAVEFRNAESRLQEYYSETAAAELPTHLRKIDIGAPLVTVVELPHDRYFDLKDYDRNQHFEGLCDLHAELSDSIRTKIRGDQHAQEEPEQPEQPQQEPREIPWAEWVAGGHVSEKCLGCEDLECSDCYSYGNGSVSSYDSDYCGEFGYYPREDEEARVAQAAILRAEHEAEAAAEESERGKRWDDMTLEEEECIWFENTRDVNDPWIEDDHNDATEAMTIPEIAASGNGGGIICAKKKAVAGAAKARREKQQHKKKEAAKFVPVKITMNTNRENAKDNEVLYLGRAQVNLPKNRNMNQVMALTQDEARKIKKRDAAKWKRINGDLKQTAARGTKVATLPDPKPWYNNENWYCCDSDN